MAALSRSRSTPRAGISTASSFENTTFANMGYVYMQEGAEYADYVSFNHCTFLNIVMYTLESGWWKWLSVTNSIFVNPYMFGYIPGADGETPVGGAINIDSIGTSNFNFLVPFTESQRHILFANNSYFVRAVAERLLCRRQSVQRHGDHLETAGDADHEREDARLLQQQDARGRTSPW